MSVSSKKGKLRIAVLASGNGSNLQALIDATAAGEIEGTIVLVISTNINAYAIMRAKVAKIETLVFEPEKFASRTLMCSKMAKALNERNVDLVCLAGYMFKLEPCMTRAFPNRIINVHPALLPKFGGKGMYGKHVHEAVLKEGEKESGCTIHIVDDQFDHGPIVAQAKVPVMEGDTADSLANRIHPAEHKLYVDVVKKICAGTIQLDQVVSK